MRAVIIGNGTIKDYSIIKKALKPNDFILCADGGYLHAQKLGIDVNLVIGDFDSSSEPADTKKYIYPKRKDLTDGELCVRYAAEHGFDEIVMLAMTGTRADHTLTNMLLLTQCKNGRIIDEHNEIFLVRDKFSVSGKKGKTLSVIPVNGDFCGVNTKGLDYPLQNETLYFGESRGNSNVISEDYCEITANGGMAFVIINNGE